MNDDDSERIERGRSMMHLVSREMGASMIDRLSRVAPDFEELLLGFAFADVWSRPTLTLRERALVRLAALAALGAPSGATRANIDSAFEVGLELDEVSECFVQTIPYVGFPQVIAALDILSSMQSHESPRGDA